MAEELKWTEVDESNAPAWVKGFLVALRVNPNVTMACRAVGISRSTPYEYRKDHPNFEIPWSEAEAEGADVLENAAFQRAVNGVQRPVYQGGELVGHVVEYSDTLTALLLKAHKPEKFRERTSTEISGPDGGPVEFRSLSDKDLDAEIAALESATSQAAQGREATATEEESSAAD